MRSLAAVAAGFVLTGCQLPKPPEVFSQAFIYVAGSYPVLAWDYTDIEERGAWCGENCVVFDGLVIAWPDDLSIGHSQRVGDIEIRVIQAAVINGRQTVTMRGRSPIQEFEYSMVDCRPPVQIDWLSEDGRSSEGLSAPEIFRSCDAGAP